MRQVYFDPFGSYTAGHATGVNTQMGVERGAREARDSDFNYNYMMPLELRAAQRQDRLGEFGLPLQMNALRYADQLGQNNVYTSNQNIAADFARMYGVTAPYDATAFSRFNVTPRMNQFVSGNADNVSAARRNWLNNLDVTAGAGVEITPEIRQNAAQAAAAHFNVPIEAVLDPNYVPSPVPQVQYYMPGPDGQPVLVGAQNNPQQRLLEQLNLPQSMEYLDALNTLRWQQIQSRYGGGGARPAANADRPSAANNYGLF